MRKAQLIAAVVFIAGVVLRTVLLGVPMIEDERKNVYIAQKISLEPGRMYLPMDDPDVTQPLLNLYLTRIGAAVFGNDVWGQRSLHWLLGCLTLVVVYLLAREWGAAAGAWAVALLAFNPYHLHASVRAENACALLFLTALAIWLFRRTAAGSRAALLCLGPVLGLAFMTKGVSVLLIAALFAWMVADRQQRHWWKSGTLYWSAFLFLVTVSPWLVWISVHGSGQLIFRPQMYAPGAVGLNPTALHFYLIEPLSRLQGLDPRMVRSWEYAAMDGVSGMILLLGVVWAAVSRPDGLGRLLLLIFTVICAVLSFFRLPGHPQGEFWWVNMTLIPACCLAGRMLADWTSRPGINRIAAAGAVIFMAVNSVLLIRQLPRDILFPPAAMCPLVDQDYTLARLLEKDGHYDQAAAELKRHKRFAPYNIEVDSYLGWIYFGQDRLDEAVLYWSRAVMQEPHYTHVTNKLRSLSDLLLDNYLIRWQKDPADRKLVYYVGVLSYYDQQYTQARDFLNQLLVADGDHTMAALYLALVDYAEKKYEDCAARLGPLLERHAGLGVAHYVRGKAYLRLGRYQAAVQSFQDALRVNSQDFKSVYYLGRAYTGLHQTDAARQAFRRARRLLHEDIVIRMRAARPVPYADIVNRTRGQE